jgi:aspartate/methionine/tyrosine aminotransferase
MSSKADWILDLLKSYKQQSLKIPIFVSDWDTLNEEAEYPLKFISNALNMNSTSVLPYTFSDEQDEIKQLVLKELGRGNVILAESNLAISLSATAALYLSIISLYKQGQRRFLLFTPVYYSIIETLKDLKADIFYYHLLDRSAFAIDFDRLENMLANNIDVLFISDPVYCVGKDISQVLLKRIADLCNKYNCYLFLDNTLGGLEWEGTATGVFNHNKIESVKSAEKYLIVDSLTKRMLVNGLKHALIFADERLVSEIEDLASQVYGGFCFPQLQLMRELYAGQNIKEVSDMLQHNIQLIKANYQLLNSFLIGSPFSLYEANSGYFTMIVHDRYLSSEVNIEAQIKSCLYDFNTFLLPPWYFNFDDQNHFGVRVNLLKQPSSYLSSFEQCIRKNVKLLH